MPEQAGISLVAENFNKYIKQLDRIDQAQQDVFNVDDKNLARAFDRATKAAKKFEGELKDVAKEGKKAGAATKGAGLAAAGAAGAGLAAVSALTSAIANLASVAASAFVEITKGGIKLNQQFELTEKVFSNVFGDPRLGKATVDFLNQTADTLRIARGEAAQFAQTILPKTGGLDEFTELLRLTDIQADTTGQSLGDLEFSIREALSGDFVSLKDRFDLGTEQINRIKELTPELGRSQALISVITDEFTRLGKTDISGTLGTNIKDLQSRFTSLQATLGKPTFDQLRIQSENLIGVLDKNEEGLERTAIALGEVTANIVELVGTELVAFIDSLDFSAIEVGISNLNLFVEALRVVSKTIKIAFETGVIQTAFGIINRDTKSIITGFTKLRQADFGQAFADIKNAVNEAAERQRDYKTRIDETARAQSNLTDENKKAIDDFLANSAAADQAKSSLDSYNNTLKQAESLQLSFARAAEDTALKLARANEDIARKQAKSILNLENKQAADRDKLLQNQAKEFDNFEKNRRKQISKAEDDIRQARKDAGEQRKRDQQKLQRELQQAQDRFNLNQLQSERRFDLQESRLRAEGDILGLKELREDFALQQTEEKENFDQSKKEQISSAKTQQKNQAQDLGKRLKELKGNLEDQRAELLASFDTQLDEQVKAQAKARDEQQRGFEEAAAEREIALAREEEDRRISQRRQLEDLGRSLAEQQGVTAEGSAAIAGELEKVFGIDGTADNIMTGFTTKTESEFTNLFKNLEKIVTNADLEPEISEPKTPTPIPVTSGGGFGGRIGGIPEFQEGGIVPGPIGSPQIIQAHGGETVLPTHQSFTMAAPVIPTQNLNVTGGADFNISGGEAAGEAAVQAAVIEMTDSFRIAVRRLARRN